MTEYKLIPKQGIDDHGPGLGANDICKMIKTAHANGVAELVVGDLRIVFREAMVSYNATTGEYIRPVGSVSQQEGVVQEAIGKEELELREDQLADLLIEDPVAYEKAIAQGDLDGRRQGQDVDSGAE